MVMLSPTPGSIQTGWPAKWPEREKTRARDGYLYRILLKITSYKYSLFVLLIPITNISQWTLFAAGCAQMQIFLYQVLLTFWSR